MSLRSLDNNNDWTFGRGRANYITGAEAINQKVSTRLKSFQNDNPLNMNSNIDWIDLLGRKGTENDILKEIERVVLQTEGVTKITKLEVLKTELRVQSISLTYDTIYDDNQIIEVTEI